MDGVGGGLYVRGQASSGNIAVSNSTFNLNRALGGGAGAFLVNIGGSVLNSNFTSNQVTGNGTTFNTGGGGIAVIGETVIPTVDITGVTIDGNSAPAGAGIAIVDSVVSVTNSTISNNVATESQSGGGGIGAIAYGTLPSNLLTVTGSIISGNTTAGEGGGIGVIDGNVLITDTAITANQANGGRGGGIGAAKYLTAGTVTIRRSTLSANTATANGGGIAVMDMGFDLENVTISGNSAGAAGGGIASAIDDDNVSGLINFSTINANTSSGGGSNLAASGISPVRTRGSIFSGGSLLATPGALVSLGNNLDSGNTGGFNQPGDLVNTNPLLGPLQDNGGSVFTHALLAGSPAIDAGGATGPATDARAIARPIDGDGNGSLLFDIGAYEAEQVQLAGVLTISPLAISVNENSGTVSLTVNRTGGSSGAVSVAFATANGTATAGADYTATSGILNFADGETSMTITVPILDDTLDEPDETFTVTLSNPTGGASTADTANGRQPLGRTIRPPAAS